MCLWEKKDYSAVRKDAISRAQHIKKNNTSLLLWNNSTMHLASGLDSKSTPFPVVIQLNENVLFCEIMCMSTLISFIASDLDNWLIDLTSWRLETMDDSWDGSGCEIGNVFWISECLWEYWYQTRELWITELYIPIYSRQTTTYSLVF